MVFDSSVLLVVEGLVVLERSAAYWSLMQVGGALIAAMALVWYAIGQRSDRVVAAGALIAAAVLMGGNV